MSKSKTTVSKRGGTAGETPTNRKNMHSLAAQLLCWFLHAVLGLPVCDQDTDLKVDTHVGLETQEAP